MKSDQANHTQGLSALRCLVQAAINLMGPYFAYIEDHAHARNKFGHTGNENSMVFLT